MKTTNTFHSIELKDIEVADRIRENLGHIEGLAHSMLSIGLLHPIVVQPVKKPKKNGPHYRLVAGGRRLAAAHSLDWPSIPCHFLSELTDAEARAIELEENLKRQDLSWSEECLAIQALHEIKTKADSEWTMEQTAELVGISQEWVSKRITVAEALSAEDETISSAVGANAAYNIIQRKSKRKLDDAVASMTDVEDDIVEPETGKKAKGKFKVHNVSFLEWDSSVKFNLLHCDFPYGIEHGRSAQGGASTWKNPYADGEDTYWQLVEHLLSSGCASESAHMIFWFSMNFYTKTVDALTAGGWKVEPYPLIWMKSDNHGILPDPNRGPRRIYETALLCARGDRHIVRPVSNAFAHPVGQKQHLSEKPYEVVHHFLRMLCDNNSKVLDPTCGSGTALAAAKSLGATNVTGIELDSDSAAIATRNLKVATTASGNGNESSGDVAAGAEAL